MEFNIEKFAKLARVKLTPKESKKLGRELQDILNHFSELQELDTKNVEPMTGGTSLRNIFRDDDAGDKGNRVKSGTEQFPESRDGYLKVPKVFE